MGTKGKHRHLETSELGVEVDVPQIGHDAFKNIEKEMAFFWTIFASCG